MSLFDTHTTKSGLPYTIREATPADAKAAIAYMKLMVGESSMVTISEGEFAMTTEQEAAYFNDNLQSPTKLFLLAIMDGEVIGSANFGGSPRRRVTHAGEFGMSVRKQYWGEGIGRSLLQELLDWAVQTGTISKVNLRVREDNERAVQLYQSFGFETEGRLREEFYCDDGYHDLLWMGLILEQNRRTP